MKQFDPKIHQNWQMYPQIRLLMKGCIKQYFAFAEITMVGIVFWQRG